MKKNLFIILIAVTFSLNITACSSENTKKEFTGEGESMSISTSLPMDGSSSLQKSSEINDSSEEGEYIEDFAKKIQTAIINKDLDSLSKLCSYPLYIDGKEITDKESLLDFDKEKLFTERLIKNIKEADVSNINETQAGFYIGDDAVVFFNETQNGMRITCITL